MIIVQLSGGFGNQLFQYAAGLSLAKNKNVQIKVDTSLLKHKDAITGTVRKLELNNLINKPLEATEEEKDDIVCLSFLEKYIDKLKPFYLRKVYKEKSNKFDLNFFKAGSHLLLKGNRQSEKYFKIIDQKLKKDFRLADDIIDSVRSHGHDLGKQNSISIHVRRGDYLTPIALEWLGILPIKYYTNAIDHFLKQEQSCKFFVFSDDIEWVKKNLKIDHDHEYISGIKSKNSMEDFYLMSQCRHNIIANSTFSWWSAWLNFNPDKIVVAPKQWYNQIKYDTSDLIPESWLRL